MDNNPITFFEREVVVELEDACQGLEVNKHLGLESWDNFPYPGRVGKADQVPLFVLVLVVVECKELPDHPPLEDGSGLEPGTHLLESWVGNVIDLADKITQIWYNDSYICKPGYGWNINRLN